MHDTLTFKYEVEDSSTVLMRMENGALATVQSNFNIPDEASLWRLDFFGTRGRLAGNGIIGQVDGGKLDAVFVDNAGKYDAKQDHLARTKKEDIIVQFGNSYEREVESFCLSLINDSPLEVPAMEAVKAQRVIEAAYRSNDSQTFVDVN